MKLGAGACNNGNPLMRDHLVEWNGHKLPTRIVNVFANYGVETVEDANRLLRRYAAGERIVNFGETCARVLCEAPFIDHY
jgi:hypothetical protein